MNHCLFKAKDTKGAVGNTVDYSSLTDNLHLRASVHHWHVSAFCETGNFSEFPITSKKSGSQVVLQNQKSL